MRLSIVIILALLCGCAAKQVLVPVPTPPTIEVRYLPAIVTQIIDSTSIDTSSTVDSLTGEIQKIINRARFRSTVTEKGRIDSIPYPVPYAVIDTFHTPTEYIHTPAWKLYWLAGLSFIFGIACMFGVSRVFK